jgi:hypothetical protein
VARRLLCTRRTVDPARRTAYDAAWSDLQAAVRARGAHAWRFVAEPRPDLFLEFLEFAAGSDPRATPAIAAALDALDREFGTGATDEWRES